MIWLLLAVVVLVVAAFAIAEKRPLWFLPVASRKPDFGRLKRHKSRARFVWQG